MHYSIANKGFKYKALIRDIQKKANRLFAN